MTRPSRPLRPLPPRRPCPALGEGGLGEGLGEGGLSKFGKWVWLKVKQEGLRRFWPMFPLTSNPFLYRFFEPQPNGFGDPKVLEW